MADFIVVVVILLIVGTAVLYIRKEKKRGVNCVGCPSGIECARKHSEAGCGGCSCSSDGEACGCHIDTK